MLPFATDWVTFWKIQRRINIDVYIFRVDRNCSFLNTRESRERDVTTFDIRISAKSFILTRGVNV